LNCTGFSQSQIQGNADGGGGILNEGTLKLTNSTGAGSSDRFGGGGIRIHGGRVTIANSTIVKNDSGELGGGLFISRGITLQNAILADNTIAFPGVDNDCSGPLISLGNNLIGDLTGCIITLQPSDRTGDAGLGTFVNPAAPGSGRVPLLSSSQAIDAGNDGACPPTDQLGTTRNGPCDIGAVEFYPVVNDLVTLGNLTTTFDPTPIPGGPVGAFRITADFTNTSTQAIVHPFVEVVKLTGGNLLLNADGGAGGVGARLTSSNGSGTPIEPGATSTFEFLIGLQRQEPFTFFVNMLGAPQTSNPLVSRR
jgi:hypothetical protein